MSSLKGRRRPEAAWDPCPSREADAFATSPAFLFEGFRLDRHGGLSRADSTPVPLGSRALDVLHVLVARSGQLVPKQDIMDAVWPGLAVEEGNLTVQVSALRKVLDAGRAGPGCIQTVPGRGYRFVWAATRIADAGGAAFPADVQMPEMPPVSFEAEASAAPGTGRRLRWPALAAALAALCTAALFFVGTRHGGAPASQPPRLSLAVLPFQNSGGDRADDHLADAITDDLTSDLSHLSDAKVVARASVRAYGGRPADVRRVGSEFDVRYVLSGSVRRLGSALRVNAELAFAETGTQIWSDRFDQNISDLGAGQHEAVIRIRGALVTKLVDQESARSARERPANPDAFDLVLQARSLWWNQPYNRERGIAAASLYERAMRLDPSSLPAMLGFADLLLEQVTDGHANADSLPRAVALVAQASAIDPNNEDVRRANVFLMRTQERWQDLAYAAQRMIDAYPNQTNGYHHLANAKLHSGKADEAVPLLETALRLRPDDPNIWRRYGKMAHAMVLLGRDPEAIAWARRTLAAYPGNDPDERCFQNLVIAAAEAWSGHPAEAQRAVAEANRIWPFSTVRSQRPRDPSSPVLLAQLRRFQEGLRRAGLRDHAEEEADFGVAPQTELRTLLAGPTPKTVPGATTIRTGELAAMLREQQPVLLDTVEYFWGPSLPGAVGLRGAGLGGSFSDQAQDRLRRKVQQLTGGDPMRPVVVVGWNSESFDGHNLALRLAALGYRQVLWYRGGREAWEAADMPETELAIQDW